MATIDDVIVGYPFKALHHRNSLQSLVSESLSVARYTTS